MGKNKSTVVGLREVVIALLDADGVPGTPEPFAKAIDLTVTPNTATNTLYADDGASITYSKTSSYGLAFQVQDLEPDQRALILGERTDKNGVVISDSEQVAPYFALGWRGRKENGKDRLIWLYKVRANDAAQSYHTMEGDNITFQTPTINMTAIGRDGDYAMQAMYDTDGASVVQQVIDDWFKAVYEPDSSLTPPTPLQTLTVTSVAGTATGDTTITATPVLPSGYSAYYQTATSVTTPALDDIVSGAPWLAFTDGSDYTATAGDEIVVVYVDAANKVKYAGKTTATVA